MSKTEKIKKVAGWFTKPVFKVITTTSEEEIFLAHCNKYLDPSAIKEEHRDKVKKAK